MNAAGFRRWIEFFRKTRVSPYRFPLKDFLDYDPMWRWSPPEMALISRDGDFLQLEIAGFRFYWPKTFDTTHLMALYGEVFAPAEYNPHAYNYDTLRVQKGDWVIDGGACEGFFTAFALNQGGRVLVIEPVKLLYDGLLHTFRKEIEEGRVRALHCCLGVGGVAKMKIDPNLPFMSSVSHDGEESVRVCSIDEILSNGTIPRVDFVKMDIEGAELEALRGARKTMKGAKPRLAIAVYHELENANTAKQIALASQPDYKVSFRGIYCRNVPIARPWMMFAK